MIKATKYSFFLFLAFCEIVAQAQTPTACFNFVGVASADTITVCVGDTVTVISCATTQDNAIGYNIRFNINPTQYLNVQKNLPYKFAYSAAGTYIVSQFINENKTTQKVVVVKTPTTPVFSVQGCNNNTVSLKFTDKSYKQYLVNWGDNSTPQTLQLTGSTTEFRYTYATSGNYTVSVKGEILPSTCGLSAQKTVTVFQALIKPEVFDVTTAAQGLQLRFDARPFLRYKVMRKTAQATSYTITDTIEGKEGIQTILIDGTANAKQEAFCVMLQTYDACGNTLNSNELCNTPIKVEVQNEKNVISWDVYKQAAFFSNYTLKRDDVVIASINNINNTQFTDVNVQCGKTYCYTITATLSVQNQVNNVPLAAISNAVCAQAISVKVPTAVSNWYATLSAAGKTILHWSKPKNQTVAGYIIARTSKNAQGGLNFKVSATDTSFTDQTPFTSLENTCYTIIYDDSCGNRSEKSASTCPVRLTAVENYKAEKTISWTSFSGLPAALGYRLEWLDMDGNIYRQSAFAANANNFTDTQLDTVHQVLRYRIRVILPDTNQIVYSNIGQIVQRVRLWIPEAFSPNNDGINDLFLMYGHFTTQITAQVYNQWGELVYKTDKLNDGWNGQYNNSDLPAGVYVLRLDVTDQTGRTQNFRQTITLVR